ncbi:hypothetical protein OYT88_12290 [Sporolactobacillus sp. CQH2019]|uniref:hypothetical protein n=1 Tax=Sporolactobacillus sp. CQH2019 TaxID=3023512 RepID=UPI002367AD38|nr:hypothetical protein [Sporolactobacillus sp. CQH2019]MDD9149320.1 hypothetical protein [Sporolactobacillus sp. CQH2019]
MNEDEFNNLYAKYKHYIFWCARRYYNFSCSCMTNDYAITFDDLNQIGMDVLFDCYRRYFFKDDEKGFDVVFKKSLHRVLHRKSIRLSGHRKMDHHNNEIHPDIIVNDEGSENLWNEIPDNNFSDDVEKLSLDNIEMHKIIHSIDSQLGNQKEKEIFHLLIQSISHHDGMKKYAYVDSKYTKQQVDYVSKKIKENFKNKFVYS